MKDSRRLPRRDASFDDWGLNGLPSPDEFKTPERGDSPAGELSDDEDSAYWALYHKAFMRTAEEEEIFNELAERRGGFWGS